MELRERRKAVRLRPGMRLGRAAYRLADLVLAAHTFAVGPRGRLLVVDEDGATQPDGERVVRSFVIRVLNTPARRALWSLELADAVVEQVWLRTQGAVLEEAAG